MYLGWYFVERVTTVLMKGALPRYLTYVQFNGEKMNFTVTVFSSYYSIIVYIYE